MEIIGRREEKRALASRLKSKEAEFIAVYGRRRVGKTCLIRHAIESSRCRSIEVTGLKDGNMSSQLELFTRAFAKAFDPIYPPAVPPGWLDAFEMLTKAIDQLAGKSPFVIFLDELPWLATARSGLLQALDHYWNTEWVNRSNVKLIVCGSAASWILDHIVNAKGGLHNRLTMTLLLKPFNLHETANYLKSRGVVMTSHQVVEIYLAMGGIPFYLRSIEKGLSPAQIVDQLCFTSTGLLYGEFDRLFSSLFQGANAYIEIVRAIAKHPQGLEQPALAKQLKLSTSGGTLSGRLAELEAAGFILSFLPYGRERKGVTYRVIDEYTLFYFRWIEPVANRIKLSSHHSNYWQSKTQSSSWKSWSGYAFEAICYKHIDQIARALRIDVGFEVGTWSYRPKSKEEKGVQIDLLLDRADGVIHLIEIKYSNKPYRITKQYATQLGDKIDVFREKLAAKKAIYLTMLTASGLLQNAYVDELVCNELTIDELFQ